MEYVTLGFVILVFLLAVFLMEWRRSEKAKKEFVKKLYEDYLSLSEKKYAPERFARISSYFERHPKSGQLDDITWNDLGMDELFKRMNYTLSSSGEEYLYDTLRTLKQDAGEPCSF